MRKRLILGLFFAGACMSVVVDRIAVTVGNEAITESEVLEELRVTSFLDSEPLDFSPASRRAAADRLVDQYLIRHEMSIGHYPQPAKNEAEQMLAKFKKAHFASEAQSQQALKKYGISEAQVKAHLLWQLAALRFTDVRFQPGIPQVSKPQAEQHATVLADPKGQHPPAAAESADSRARQNPRSGTSRAAKPAANTVDDRLDSWLKEMRSQTRVEFKKGAFE